MKEGFAALLELQEVDVRIDELRARLEDLAAGGPLREPEEELRKTEAALKRRTAELQRAELEARRQEAEARQLRAERERLEKRLYGGEISNVKEMEKMQERMRHLAETADRHETAAIEAMEKVEQLAPVVERLRARRERLQGIIARRRAEIETESKELRQQLEVLEQRSAQARARVPRELLEPYDFHRARRHGAVVAPVEGDRCAGCGVTLSVALLSRVRKQSRLETCENCGRLLVLLEQ